MTPKSAKGKGREFERKVVEAIRASGLDQHAGREVGSGSGSMKGDVRTSLPYIIEAKDHKQYEMSSWIRQVKKEASIGSYDPDKWILVFKDIDSPSINPDMLAVLPFSELIELLKNNRGDLFPEMGDKELIYSGRKAYHTLNEFLKHIEKYK